MKKPLQEQFVSNPPIFKTRIKKNCNWAILLQLWGRYLSGVNWHCWDIIPTDTDWTQSTNIISIFRSALVLLVLNCARFFGQLKRPLHQHCICFRTVLFFHWNKTYESNALLHPHYMLSFYYVRTCRVVPIWFFVNLKITNTYFLF